MCLCRGHTLSSTGFREPRNDSGRLDRGKTDFTRERPTCAPAPGHREGRWRLFGAGDGEQHRAGAGVSETEWPDNMPSQRPQGPTQDKATLSALAMGPGDCTPAGLV